MGLDKFILFVYILTDMTQRYYTPEEVAKICGVTRHTVYMWIYKGKIHAESLGNHYRKLIPEMEIPTFYRFKKGVVKSGQK